MAVLIWLLEIRSCFRKNMWYFYLHLMGKSLHFFLPFSYCVIILGIFVLPTAGNCSLTENAGLDGSSLMESSVQSIFLLKSDPARPNLWSAELLPSPVMEPNHRALTYCHSEPENSKIAARNLPRLQKSSSSFQSIAARLWQDCLSEVLNTNKCRFCSLNGEKGAKV